MELICMRHLKFKPIWIGGTMLAMSLILFSGCKRNVAARSTGTVTAAGNSKESPWNWEEYPPVTRMRIGVLPCQLQPKSMITMNSPLLGILRVYVNSPQMDVPSGFLWAEFEPEIFAAEQKTLEQARLKMEEREKVQTEIEIPKQKLQLERQIEENQRQVALLRLLSTNKELADLTISVEKDNPLRPDSLRKSELELSLLTRSLTYLEETNSITGIDLTAMRNDWERRKLDFERRQGQARFKMPFDGRLTVSIPLTEGVTNYPVNVGQEIGVARDFSSVRVRVTIANSAWSSLPGENLSALVRLPSGEELIAPFSYQKIERVQNREESVYYFQFPAEKSQTAARLVGSTLTCELWASLPKPVRIIPKMALIMHKPDALEGRTWSHGLAVAFPGTQLLVEGQTDLGVFLPEGMPLKKM